MFDGWLEWAESLSFGWTVDGTAHWCTNGQTSAGHQGRYSGSRDAAGTGAKHEALHQAWPVAHAGAHMSRVHVNPMINGAGDWVNRQQQQLIPSEIETRKNALNGIAQLADSVSQLLAGHG